MFWRLEGHFLGDIVEDHQSLSEDHKTLPNLEQQHSLHLHIADVVDFWKLEYMKSWRDQANKNNEFNL